jgi:hypothetical protein
MSVTKKVVSNYRVAHILPELTFTEPFLSTIPRRCVTLTAVYALGTTPVLDSQFSIDFFSVQK